MKIHGVRQSIHPLLDNDETLTEIQIVLKTEFGNKATIKWHRANHSPTFELQQSSLKQRKFIDVASDLADLIARVRELMEIEDPISYFEWTFVEKIPIPNEYYFETEK